MDRFPPLLLLQEMGSGEEEEGGTSWEIAEDEGEEGRFGHVSRKTGSPGRARVRMTSTVTSM